MKLSSFTTSAAAVICISTDSAVYGQEQTEVACTFGSLRFKCGPVGQESHASVYFENNDSEEEGGTYQATVEFDFGPMQFVTAEDFPFGERITRNQTYIYKEPGIYEVGRTVTFGDNAGSCSNNSVFGTALLNISDASCRYGITTNAPTISPSPTTLEPTLEPTLPPSAATATVHGQYYFAATATVMFMFLA
mmetsp:Transcript_166/g.416  ORF Transcript_166/g.416 Transcript_166/m.416 type:complete len:192 (-) Transcript_166:55-630(-)